MQCEIHCKSRSLGLDTALRAYSTGARSLNLMTLGVWVVTFGELNGITLEEMETRHPTLFTRWKNKADVEFEWPGGERSSEFTGVWTMTRKHGDRFRLLIYERMWQRWAWPCTLIIPASLVLWWFAYRIPIIYALFRPLALVPALVAGVILAYAYLARHLAWVQCRSEHLRIRAPFYTLVVSYGRIRTVRPNNFSQVFDPRKEREARLRWLHPYWGKTVLLVELSRYPFSKTWLRLWFNPYLLTPSSSGFIFLVEDWMALSRQLDEYRNVWVMRRAKRRQRASAKRL